MKKNHPHLVRRISLFIMIVAILFIQYWIATQFTFGGLLIIMAGIIMIMVLIVPNFKKE